jgi:hypothetical protein
MSRLVNPGLFADAYLVTIALAAHVGMFPWMCGMSESAPALVGPVSRDRAPLKFTHNRKVSWKQRPCATAGACGIWSTAGLSVLGQTQYLGSHRAAASMGLFGLPGINTSNPMLPATAKAAP